MMAERDWLARLKVGESRHDVGCMLFGAGQESGFKRVDALNRRVH